MNVARIVHNIKKFFLKLGLDLRPKIWHQDPVYRELRKQMSHRTLVSSDRCFVLYQLAKSAAHQDGAFAEVGVFKGGTAWLMAAAAPSKTIHLFDTFSGLPPHDASIDGHVEGEFSETSLESVQDFLAGYPNVEFHQGFFPATAGPVENTKFSLVSVDGDLYQTTKDALEFFYPRLVSGGVMVFDDYEWEGCLGVKKAIFEFLEGRPEEPIVTARYQSILIKH
jgi:predicted O-methyltransferase YrrM